MKRDSKTQLSHSVERRLNNVMVTILDQFEYLFSDLKDSDDGKKFRFNIKNILNDVIRASKAELDEYTVEYRPLRIEGNTFSLSKSSLDLFQEVKFYSRGIVELIADIKKIKELNAVREELGVGVLRKNNDSVSLIISGVNNCINKVIPFLDCYTLISKYRSEYSSWREIMVKEYINGN